MVGAQLSDGRLFTEGGAYRICLVTENQERKRRRGGVTDVSLSIQVMLEVKFVLFAEAVNVGER